MNDPLRVIPINKRNTSRIIYSFLSSRLHIVERGGQKNGFISFYSVWIQNFYIYTYIFFFGVKLIKKNLEKEKIEGYKII